ncbi:MAG: right-handed parallel beta-helix repeat-containing protein [Acidobacteriota bacterium]
MRPSSCQSAPGRARGLGGALALGLLLATSARAITIVVPDDAATIQEAVDLAEPGDLVRVSAGSYVEQVSVMAKTDLRIEGAGAGLSVIEAAGHGGAFTIGGCTQVDVSGFTLGSELIAGGSPSVGAVVVVDSQEITVHHLEVTSQSGNGILVLGSEAEIYDNVIHRVGDDAISLYPQSIAPSVVVIHHNTIVDNQAGSAVGVWAQAELEQVVVFNNIFLGNDFGLATTAPEFWDHDHNLISESTREDYNGGLVRQANEIDCDPGFADRVGADYHVMTGSCVQDAGIDVFMGYPAASVDFEWGPRPTGLGHEMGADELGCAAFTAVPTDLASCTGEEVALDATALALIGCDGSVSIEWLDDPGAPAIRMVSPVVDTAWEVMLTCDADPSCSAVEGFTVSVESAPTEAVAMVVDEMPCAEGLLVSWTAADFADPDDAVYNVYRSELDCADALTQPPVLVGSTELSWLDTTTVGGRTYHYVVEAEDGEGGGPCLPRGVDHDGAATRSCFGPITDQVTAPPPEGVFTVLFARNEGEEITLDWSGVRALEPGESFYLLKAVAQPTALFLHVNGDGSVATSYTETDTSSPRQFFDLRVENLCGEISEDEYPPGP